MKCGDCGVEWSSIGFVPTHECLGRGQHIWLGCEINYRETPRRIVSIEERLDGTLVVTAK